MVGLREAFDSGKDVATVADEQSVVCCNAHGCRSVKGTVDSLRVSRRNKTVMNSCLLPVVIRVRRESLLLDINSTVLFINERDSR